MLFVMNWVQGLLPGGYRPEPVLEYAMNVASKFAFDRDLSIEDQPGEVIRLWLADANIAIDGDQLDELEKQGNHGFATALTMRERKQSEQVCHVQSVVFDRPGTCAVAPLCWSGAADHVYWLHLFVGKICNASAMYHLSMACMVWHHQQPSRLS